MYSKIISIFVVGFSLVCLGNAPALGVGDTSLVKDSINSQDFMTRFEQKYPEIFSFSKWDQETNKFVMGVKGEMPLEVELAAKKFAADFKVDENTGYSQKELFDAAAFLVRHIESAVGVKDSDSVFTTIDPTTPSIGLQIDNSVQQKFKSDLIFGLESISDHLQDRSATDLGSKLLNTDNPKLLAKLKIDVNMGNVKREEQALYGGGRISGNNIGYCTTGFTASKPGYPSGILTAGHCLVGTSPIVYGMSNSKIALTRVTRVVNNATDAGFLSAAGYVTAPQFWSLPNGGLTTVTWKFTPSIGQKLAFKGETSSRRIYDSVSGYVCGGVPRCGKMYTKMGATQAGDSGGPWFSSGGAAGIHGGLVTFSDGTVHSYFTTISKAESVTGTTIKVG